MFHRTWFQLVDATGNRYKNNGATTVPPKDDGSLLDVGYLKRAVKVECANVLASFDAFQLSVYKNKAAFDANELLDEDYVFKDEQGFSKKDAIIVVVPPLPVAPLTPEVRFDTELAVLLQNQANKKRAIQDDSKPKAPTFLSLQDVEAVDIENCTENSWIDTQEIEKVTPFTGKYFVRKESIDIFKLLKRAGTRQIVLVGSPGVGKSLLLVLYSFWQAFGGRKIVLLVRHVKGKEQGKGLSITLLNGQRPSESWKIDDMSYREIEPMVKKVRNQYTGCEICLDGFCKRNLELGPLMQFSVLATSAQFERKGDDLGVLDRYLVPFWSMSDLALVGQKNNWDHDRIKQKYYYSGGSLRMFLEEEGDVKIAALESFDKVDLTSANLLMTQYAAGSDGQVDRIRMTTVNTNNLENYKNSGQWFYVICSEYALRKLGEYITLDYYKALCDKAYLINDPGLFGIAFENYFHTMARDQKAIPLMIRQYDRKKAKTKHNYTAITIESKRHLRKGKVEADYEKILTSWTDDFDYWYPEDKLTTIDSIAKIDGKFLLLQLTKAENHSIDTTYLNIISKRLNTTHIDYIAIVPNKEICDEFRLKPAAPDTTLPLNVAYINDEFFVKFVWKKN